MKQLFPLLVLAAAVSSGCAASTELDGEQLGADDSVGDVEQAFTEAACPTLTPDRLISVVGHNKSATARSSGTNYGTDTRCPKAFRVDVQAINAATASVYVYWQSPFPQSKTACEKANAFLRLYEKVNGSYKLRSATFAIPKWSGSSCNGLFAWSDVQNIGNGNDWVAVTQAVGSDDKIRPVEVLLYSY